MMIDLEQDVIAIGVALQVAEERVALAGMRQEPDQRPDFWKKGTAFSCWLRKTSVAMPWNWLPPDFVERMKVPPGLLPYSALAGPVTMRNSPTALGEILTAVCECELKANQFVLAPSTT